MFRPARALQHCTLCRCRAAASDGLQDVAPLGPAQIAEARDATMLEYLELKQYLLRRTQRAGYFLTAYLLLASSAETAACAAVGGAASYLYMVLLCRDIDNLSPDDEVPMARANELPPGPQRAVSRVVAGLQEQLKPRLLVRALGQCLIALASHAASDSGCCKTCSRARILMYTAARTLLDLSSRAHTRSRSAARLQQVCVCSGACCAWSGRLSVQLADG